VLFSLLYVFMTVIPFNISKLYEVNIGFKYFSEVVLTRLTIQYSEHFTCRHCYVDQNYEIAP